MATQTNRRLQVFVTFRIQQLEEKILQRCSIDHFPGKKEEANLQNESEPHPVKNETARLRQIITDCLTCRISKIQKEFFEHTGRESNAHSSQDGNVNLHVNIPSL